MHEYLKGSKKYVVTIELGTATDTYDREGTITHRKDVKVSRRDIEALIPEFVGDPVWQSPPM
jgi:tRNA pseudouridine55 synthase